MKRRNNRFLAGTLAGLMMLTMLPVTALAAENGTADETATLTAESIAPVSETLNSSTANVVNDDKDSPAEKAESNDSTDQQGDSSSNTGENSDSNPSANNNGEGSENSTAEKAKSNDSSDKQGDSSSNTTGNSDSNPSANNNGEGGENNTPAPTFTAKIGDTEYETLDAAINAAQDGDTIEIGENCTLTVGTIEKAVVINGNDKTISIPEQNTENHALNINASLTFNKATVEFPDAETSTHSWAFTMNREGKLTLDNGSTCIIKHQIIDACNDATINVLNGSVLKVLDAGDDIYNGTYKYKTYTCDGRITFAPVGENWVLDDCKDPIVGWYQDGAGKRWNGDATDESYYAKEYIVVPDTVVVPDTAVSDALALKAAHGKFCNVTYEVTGDIPSDAGNPPASAKVKMGGSYTVAPAQTTSQSRYTFIGWRVNGIGDIVTSLENLQQDVKLVGVWSYRSSGGSSGGGGGRKPTVDIPDDVPTGLNGDDHFAYIVGYPDGNVNPGGNITRAEVATIFFRLLTEDVRTANSTQSNSLSDVSRGQWFNHAISTLSSMGIVKGNPDGTFDPDAPITRAEFAAIAARFDDKNTNTTSNFSDIASHWAKDEIGVAANKGWINGYPDSTFRPDQYITRAEAMTLVNRVLNRLPEKSEDLLDDMIKWPDNADASVWYYLAVQEATNSHDYSDKSDADKYEKWTKIRDARDWTLLEK